MPHYDYKCQDCGYVFEVFQKMTDAVLTECPKCKGSVKRMIGPGSGLIFKGSGFYITDYKRKSSPDSSSYKPESKKKGPGSHSKPVSKQDSDCSKTCPNKNTDA